MALSGLAITGIILIIVALIMIIVAVVLLIIDSSTSISWWVWLILGLGVVLAIVGSVMLAISLAEPEVPSCPLPQPACPIVPPTCPSVKPVCPSKQCPYAQVKTYTAPIIQAPVAVVPNATYSERIEKVGIDSFDPDPISTSVEIPGQVVRRNVVGPYGPSGENIQISGLHRTAPTRRIITRDIGEHPVNLVNDEF